MSLHALGLHPSASLVVSKQSVGGASVPMETSPSHTTGSSTSSDSKQVSFGREQIIAARSHYRRQPQGITMDLVRLVIKTNVHRHHVNGQKVYFQQQS